jgi:very-short-patch-repair endonuclease
LGASQAPHKWQAEREDDHTAKTHTLKMIHRAGELRTPARAGGVREEPTPAESKLWAYLRTLREDGVHFRRQHAIGPYIVDFCSPRCKLIIELDGPPFGRST